jgi:monofunctional biosynthetic peptidoglycan transglycosylase
VLRQRWVPLRELPPALAWAVLSAEDQRFVLHHGFDFQAIRHALGAGLQGRELRGASTLSQQVAKNLFLWEGRSWARKALEAYFTVSIEALWSKRRILEVYLNIAELGDGVFGVAAAARHHFGREVSALSAEQAAWLAAILPSPRTARLRPPSPRLQRKQRWILEQMGTLRTRPDLVGALRLPGAGSRS